MKKIPVIVLLFLAFSALGASTYYFVLRKGKVGSVSEDPIKPTADKPLISTFVHDYMAKEKQNLVHISLDSNSETSRLAKLGFNAKVNNAFDQYTAQALLDLHNSYEALYPQQQFITFGCLKNILEKYELNLGTSATFNAPIPTYAIDSMEKFKASYLLGYEEIDFENNHTDVIHTALASNGYGNLTQYFELSYNRVINGRGTLSKIEKDFVKYALLDKARRSMKTFFLVVAPAEYFVGEANINGVFGAPKDPLILAPVEGGYIIVAAW